MANEPAKHGAERSDQAMNYSYSTDASIKRCISVVTQENPVRVWFLKVSRCYHK
jgi:hypothetical protein